MVAEEGVQHNTLATFVLRNSDNFATSFSDKWYEIFRNFKFASYKVHCTMLKFDFTNKNPLKN